MSSLVRRINVLYVVAAVLFIVTVAVAASGARGDRTGFRRAASVYDDGPGGTALLRRWLEDTGVRTRVLQGDRFVIDPNDAVVLILGATETITAEEAAGLDRFVSGGGTVVVATDLAASEAQLLRTYRMGIAAVARPPASAVGAVGAATGARTLSLDFARTVDPGPAGVEVAHAANGPVAAMVAQHDGAVFVVGSLAPFLSGQIGEGDNGRFVLALLASAIRRHGTVVFDEYHHGAHPAPDVLALLERTWPGRTLLVMGLLVFVFIVLTGRRLGTPLPLEHRPARSSLDHVRAFAGLVRRSGHGEIARDRLRRDLRSRLARVAGVDPAVPLERILAGLAGRGPGRVAEAREIDALLALPLRDADLLRTVRRIDALLREEAP